MSRTLYSPRLSDDVVSALYREGQRRRIPMTRLADELLRQSLAEHPEASNVVHLRDHQSAGNRPCEETGAA